MPNYTQDMVETRTYKVRYTVRARNKTAAMDKLAIGDTVSELALGSGEVINREPYGVLLEWTKRGKGGARRV